MRDVNKVRKVGYWFCIFIKEFNFYFRDNKEYLKVFMLG